MSQKRSRLCAPSETTLGQVAWGQFSSTSPGRSAPQPEASPVERELSTNLKRAPFAELVADKEKATAELADKHLLAESDLDAIAAEAIETGSALAILQGYFTAEHEMMSSLTSQAEELQSRLDVTQKQAERNATAAQETLIAAAASERKTNIAMAVATAATACEAAPQARIIGPTDRLTMKTKHQ